MQKQHLKPLTGIRFIAAFIILCLHLKEEYNDLWATDIFDTLFQHGYMGVDLFFILSGFVLSYNYFESYRIRKHFSFIKNRFIRLWPIHAATLSLIGVYILFLSIRGINPYESDSLSSFLLELLMVRCWTTDELGWNYPAWSIHAEWFAYIFIFPVCIFISRRPKTLIRYYLYSIVTLIIAYLICSQLPTFLSLIVFPFSLGCFLYPLTTRVKFQHSIVLWVSIIVLILSIFLNLDKIVLHLSLAGIIIGMLNEKSTISKILSHKAFVYGGKISYVLYMTHSIFESIYTKYFLIVSPFDLPLFKFFSSLILIIGPIVFAIVWYEFFDKPIHTWLRKLKKKN